MKRKKSTKLFDLIQSMTRTEKRSFKLNVIRDQDTQLIKLFDEIKKQKEYDEEKLKKKIYGKVELKTKKFDVLKHQLYKRILKEISQDFDPKSVDFKIKKLLMQVRVLYSKFLFFACKETLDQARKIALDNDYYLSLLEILKWEKKIAYSSLDTPYLKKEFQRIFEEEQEYLGKINLQTKYWYVLLEQLIMAREGEAKENEHKKELLRKAMEDPLLVCPPPKDEFEQNLFYYYAKSLLHYNANELDTFYEYSKFAFLHIRENKAFCYEEATFFIFLAGNYVGACLMYKKIKEAKKNIEYLKPDSQIELSYLYQMYSRYFSLKLTLVSELGSFKEGIELIKEIGAIEQKNKWKFPVDNYFLFAYLLFGLQDYDEALFWISSYLNQPKNKIRQDLENASRILRLMIAYEKKDYQLVEALMRSTYRFLKRSHHYQGLEKIMFQFVKKMNHPDFKKEEVGLLKEIQEKITLLEKDSTESYLLSYINLEAWIEAKLTNQTFPSVIRTSFLDDL